MEWKNIYRGILIGMCDVVPGISGGTVAFILGIYERLINAISGFFSKDWYKHLTFLLPLGMGMGIAIISFSHVIEFLLRTYPEPTQFLFLGLVVGVLPLLVKESNIKETFKARHYTLLVVSLLLLASMAFLQESTRPIIVALDMNTAIILFFAGALASTSMLLPGISGSMVLLILGFYTTAITAIKDFNFPIIIVIGLGVAVGFILSSKMIKYILVKYPVMTYAAIIGLVTGSTAIIYNGFAESFLGNVMCVISFIFGLIIVQFIANTNNRLVQKSRA
ncbi:DUF368 domain-containing protein [Sutcliffiella rhizosphaerae]|uniref:DUF368 domain-containing protein n=1 Tax=Sutcliffiella rhizosphaerae TaxID=2880967 RepID=A0ABM8YJ29_9BACI|nr:DUF368 domain-containing protein [Sutcliffiella rhizosphaerae]CAG9619898.1 hypothetical protein BACCIP111883_00666 [Sutcliffiella rhizosphaerae]